MIYTIEKTRYSLNYQNLRDNFYTYKNYSDKEFINNLPILINFACKVGYLKEFNHDMALSDKGIIGRLSSLLVFEEFRERDLKETRDLFNQVLSLA